LINQLFFLGFTTFKVVASCNFAVGIFFLSPIPKTFSGSVSSQLAATPEVSRFNLLLILSKGSAKIKT
jgi:hypothetical protein